MDSIKKWRVALGVLIGLGALGAPGAFAPQAAWAADKLAPDFALPRSGDGKLVKLSDYKGKVRLVNFWATWCPPCRAEIPEFIKFYGAMKAKGVEIIGISMDSTGDKDVAPFVKDHKITYPVVLGDEKTALAYGGIRGIPTTFIVDRKGRIVKKYVGMPAADEAGVKDALMKEIAPLL